MRERLLRILPEQQMCPRTVPGKPGHVVTLPKRGKASLTWRDLTVSSLPLPPFLASLRMHSLNLFVWPYNGLLTLDLLENCPYLS